MRLLTAAGLLLLLLVPPLLLLPAGDDATSLLLGLLLASPRRCCAAYWACMLRVAGQTGQASQQGLQTRGGGAAVVDALDDLWRKLLLLPCCPAKAPLPLCDAPPPNGD